MKTYKKIACITLVLALFLMVIPSVNALPPPPLDPDGNPYPYTPFETIQLIPSDGTGKYEEYFIEYLNSEYENESFQYYYDELFEYSEKSTATVDYVIVECYKDYIASAGGIRLITEGLVFISDYNHCPYSLSYFVFIPETSQILTIEEAIKNIPDISGVLLESGICRMLGDANNDGEINVRDATAIQKKLAGLITLDDEYSYDYSTSEKYNGYYSDFNCDDKLDIKDATAIQKLTAGLE